MVFVWSDGAGDLPAEAFLVTDDGMRVTVRIRRALLQSLLAVVMLAMGVVQAQPIRSPELNAQYHRAETAWRSGSSLLEAKTRVDRVIRALPDDADARKLRAQVLLALDEPSRALEDARKAVELRPTDGEAHLIVAEASRLGGQLEQARTALDQAGQLLLDDAGLHVRLSWNALELGQLHKAEAYARTARALDPALPAAFYQLARVFVRQDRPDDAVAVLRRGFEQQLLTPHVLLRDTLLAPLATNDVLRDWVR